MSDLSAISAAFQGFQVPFSLEGDPFAVLERFRADARRLHRGHRAMVEEAAVDAAVDLLRAGIGPAMSHVVHGALPRMRLAARVGGRRRRRRARRPGRQQPVRNVRSHRRPGANGPWVVRRAYCMRRHRRLPERKGGCRARRTAWQGSWASAPPQKDEVMCRVLRVRARRCEKVRREVFPSWRDAESQESFASFAFPRVPGEGRFGGQLDASGEGGRPWSHAGRRPIRPGALPGIERLRAGEEHLVRGVGLQFRAVDARNHPEGRRGRLTHLELSDFMRGGRVGGRSLVSMSASAMEAYLDCPYKWFVERADLLLAVWTRNSGCWRRAISLTSCWKGCTASCGTLRCLPHSRLSAAGGLRIVPRGVVCGVKEQYESLRTKEGTWRRRGLAGLPAQRLVSRVWRSALLHRALPEDMRVAVKWNTRSAKKTRRSRRRVRRLRIAREGRPHRRVRGRRHFRGHRLQRKHRDVAGDDCMLFAPADEERDIDPSSLPRHVRIPWSCCFKAGHVRRPLPGRCTQATGPIRHPVL